MDRYGHSTSGYNRRGATMSKPITKIQMTGFRGAVGAFDLDFDTTRDFVMLFGENGSGKSSILDAVDVVCRGTNGCLDSISVGQNPGKYLCSLGSQPTNLRVTVHSNGESWTGTMRRNAISVAGSVVKPKVKILRRNAILELVLAQLPGANGSGALRQAGSDCSG